MTGRTLPDPLPAGTAEEQRDRSAAEGPPRPIAAALSIPEEPVTSPDQHKPGNRRLDYIGALGGAALLLLLLVADHPNGVETAWVGGCAAALLIAVVVDWQLRRRGLRS
jgi:hypothetical protein